MTQSMLQWSVDVWKFETCYPLWYAPQAHLLYLANSYFYNYKPSPPILHQHRILQILRKYNDVVISKPDKGNGVVILDQKLSNNAIEEIISNTSKFEKLNEDPTLKVETKKLF